jgi:hypothetical protein
MFRAGTPLASPHLAETTMLRLGQRQRGVLIDKVPDMANVAAGSMIFGQFLTDRSFSMVLAAAGIATWIALWALTLVLAEDEIP